MTKPSPEPIRVILLAASQRDLYRWVKAQDIRRFVVMAYTVGGSLEQNSLPLTSARIIRTDKWEYSDAVVQALHRIHAKTPLLDPTGLLGIPADNVSERRITQSKPIGAIVPKTSRVRKAVTPRKAAPGKVTS